MDKLETYPRGRGDDVFRVVLDWSEGFARDSKHWFFLSFKGYIWRIQKDYPVEYLTSEQRFDESWGGLRTQLERRGGRYVDIDAYGDYLFTVEAGGDVSFFQVVSKETLEVLYFRRVSGRHTWCMFNPYDNHLYTSQTDRPTDLKRFEFMKIVNKPYLRPVPSLTHEYNDHSLDLSAIHGGACSPYSDTFYLVSNKGRGKLFAVGAQDLRLREEQDIRLAKGGAMTSVLVQNLDTEPNQLMRGQVHILAKLRGEAHVFHYASDREDGPRLRLGVGGRVMSYVIDGDVPQAEQQPNVFVRPEKPTINFKESRLKEIARASRANRPARRAYVWQPTLYELEPEALPDRIRSIVIQVHGVSNKQTDKGHQKFPKHALESYSDEMKHTLFLRMYWGNESFIKASNTVGKRTDNFDGMGSLVWAGAAKLKELVGRIRHEFSQDIPITVVSHSQGTVLTLSALQDGLKLSNWVLMGSVLGKDDVKTASGNVRFARAVSNVEGLVVNCWSPVDGVLDAKDEFGGDAPIGKYGLPDRGKNLDIRYYPVNGRHNVVELVVRDNGHSDWWTRHWFKPTARFDTFPGLFTPQEFIDVLRCSNITRDDDEIKTFPAYKEAVKELQEEVDWSENFTTASWSMSGASNDSYQRMLANLHILPGLRQRFHYSDMDQGNFRIFVKQGSVLVKMSYAIGHTFNRSTGSVLVGPGKQVHVGRLATPKRRGRVRQDATFMLELYNNSSEMALVTVVFAAIDK